MERIKGISIFLRALELTDLAVLLRIENNQAFWHLSDTTSAFSKELMQEYLSNAKATIDQAKQYRFAICKNESREVVGLVDLFDYDALHKRAGVGILIENVQNRKKGYATEALSLLLDYTKDSLGLHQVYANILEDNEPSIALFEKRGFRKIGTKKEWRSIGGKFKNELLYQYIL